MKTLISSALIAVAALSAVPASANSIAFEKLHGHLEGSERLNVAKLGQGATDGVTVSTRSGNNAAVYDRFNGDYDRASDIRGQNGATAFSGNPSAGADIFDRIRAESLENE